MYTIERFYCADLPTGAIGFGYFTIIFSVITAVLCILEGNLSALFVYTFFGVGSGVLLIVGVKKSSEFLLLPWLGFNAFHIVITTPISLIMLFWKHLSEPAVLFGSLIYLALYTCFIIYGWIGVYSLYLKFKNKEPVSSSSRGQV